MKEECKSRLKRQADIVKDSEKERLRIQSKDSER